MLTNHHELLDLKQPNGMDEVVLANCVHVAIHLFNSQKFLHTSSVACASLIAWSFVAVAEMD